MINTKFTVEVPKELMDKLNNQLTNANVMQEVHEQLAETVNPWTPYLTGALSQDLTITPDGVTYNVPYSAEKYYGYAYTKEFHPLATSHWDEVAMQTELDSFTEKVKEIIVRNVNR